MEGSIWKFGSFLTENTLFLYYKDQPENIL
jgi:hypothetical protein